MYYCVGIYVKKSPPPNFSFLANFHVNSGSIGGHKLYSSVVGRLSTRTVTIVYNAHRLLIFKMTIKRSADEDPANSTLREGFISNTGDSIFVSSISG